MKRALVTGASGFVGANLARRLLRDGHEVHLFLRASHEAWRVDEIRGDVRAHTVEVQDRERVAAAVREIKPDWAFHLAAYGAYSQQTGLERMAATNLIGTASLLEACADVGVEAFVHAGSSSEYGYKDHAPREDELIEPNSDYAITKAAATHYCQLVARTRGVHAVTLRLYSVYGPYEEPTRLVPTLIVQGLNGRLPPLAAPQTARDFVHVDDAAEAMLRVAAAEGMARGAVFNVASGVQTTLERLSGIARRELQIGVEPVWGSMAPRPWDTRVWVGDAAALAAAVSWRAAIDIETGLRRTIEWFERNPRWLAFYSERILR